jgi:hypothetical protein
VPDPARPGRTERNRSLVKAAGGSASEGAGQRPEFASNRAVNIAAPFAHSATGSPSGAAAAASPTTTAAAAICPRYPGAAAAPRASKFKLEEGCGGRAHGPTCASGAAHSSQAWASAAACRYRTRPSWALWPQLAGRAEASLSRPVTPPDEDEFGWACRGRGKGYGPAALRVAAMAMGALEMLW